MDDLTDLEQLKSGMMVESLMEIIINMMGPAYASVQGSTNRFFRIIRTGYWSKTDPKLVRSGSEVGPSGLWIPGSVNGINKETGKRNLLI